MADVRVIAADKLDGYMQGVLLRADSLSRKVVQSMIAVSGGSSGGGASVVMRMVRYFDPKTSPTRASP